MSDHEYIDTDDENDRYRLIVNPSKPRKITEKKLRDQAALQAHIEKTQRDAARSAVPFSDPSKQSLAQLMNQYEGHKIIASPREYQIELFERAKERNLLVVLPTGMFPHPSRGLLTGQVPAKHSSRPCCYDITSNKSWNLEPSESPRKSPFSLLKRSPFAFSNMQSSAATSEHTQSPSSWAI